MLRPMACVWSRKTRPSVFSISPKYFCGLTRTSAPVGQFSSHEYAGRLAPDGFSGVLSHKLHLIATMSSASANGAGLGALTLNRFLTRSGRLRWAGAGASRGTIEIAL